MKDQHLDLKILFFSYLNYLRSVSGVVSRRRQTIRNRDLATAASRVNVPYPFKAYISLIEQSTKKPFPTNLSFTADEVRKMDSRIIDDFKVMKLDLKEINIDALIHCAIITGTELGLIPGNPIEKHQIMNVASAANTFQGSTSAGFPYYRKKEVPVVREDAITWTHALINKFNFWTLMSCPVTVFHRFQYRVSHTSGKTEVTKKIRPVWGLPFRVLTLEAVIFRNMINTYIEYSRRRKLTGVAKTHLDISDIIASFRMRCKRIVSTDFVRFDSKIATFMWPLFFALVRPHINFGSTITEEIYKGVMAYSAFTPFCWNSTELQFQRRGLPSGSLLTSMFGTFCSRLIINYAAYERSNGRRTAREDACCLGDDLIYNEQLISLRGFVTVAKKFGLEMDLSKCLVLHSQNASIPFLGFYWDTQNRPIQFEPWYIAHLCLPSRFIDTKQYGVSLDILQTYRGICICMSTYKGMEIFHKLVGWGDYVYQNLLREYREGRDPIIQYVGEDQRYTKLRIPLSLIFSEGWKAF